MEQFKGSNILADFQTVSSAFRAFGKRTVNIRSQCGTVKVHLVSLVEFSSTGMDR